MTLLPNNCKPMIYSLIQNMACNADLTIRCLLHTKNVSFTFIICPIYFVENSRIIHTHTHTHTYSFTDLDMKQYQSRNQITSYLLNFWWD